jgi:hypothetical protein
MHISCTAVASESAYRDAHVVRHRGTHMPGAAKAGAVPALTTGADLNAYAHAPYYARKLALARPSPNLSCLSPVCWLFRLPTVDPTPMQDACPHRVTGQWAPQNRRAPSPSLRPAFIMIPCPRRTLPLTSLLSLPNLTSCVSSTPPPRPPPSLTPRAYPLLRPWYTCEPPTFVPSPRHHPTDIAPTPYSCCLTIAFTAAADPTSLLYRRDPVD